jgi:pimeloyl-ACP methyl ester carboxylesterase
VAFVIADSAPSDLKELLDEKLSETRVLNVFPLKQLVYLNLAYVFNIDVRQASPKAVVAGSRVPILLIYGEQDPLLVQGRELQAELQNPQSRLVVFAGANHVQSFDSDSAGYAQLVTSFVAAIH